MCVVGGGKVRVAGDRLCSVLFGALAWMVQYKTCAGIGCNAMKGNIFMSGALTPLFGPDKKSGLATLTPVECCTVHKLVPPLGD